MPRSKNRRKSGLKVRARDKDAPKESRKESDGPVFFRSPLASVPPEEIRQAVIRMGKEAENEIPRLRESLIQSLKSSAPLYMMSNLSLAIINGMSDDGQQSKPRDTPPFPSHIEFAQALLLTIPEKDLNFTHADPAHVQQVWDGVPALFHAFSNILGARFAEHPPETKLESIGASLRLHTQFVRNWGHFNQVVQILTELYAPLDTHYEERVGYSATNTIRLFLWLLQRMEHLMTDQTQKIRDALDRPNKQDIAAGYAEAFPEFKTDVDELTAYLEHNKFGSDDVRAIIFNDYFRKFAMYFLFDAQSASKALGCDLESTERILDQLSLSLGSLADTEFEYLFLGNPVWLRPILRLDRDVYYCCLPVTFFSFAFHILDEMLDGDPAANRLQHRRAEFLEDKISELFIATFKNGTILKNTTWRLEGRAYETDLLVKIDSYLLIVEAKSHSISWPALRGAPKRAKRHIDEILLHPAQQSARLENALRDKFIRRNSESTLELDLPFELNERTQVIRLSVTLEDFATIQSNLRDLLEDQDDADRLSISVTMSVADLECVFDILAGPAQVLHYLVRRTELQDKFQYRGDELDLLGMYLMTGFCLGEMEHSGKALQLIGMSSDVDGFYEAAAQGIQAPKPQYEPAKWFGEILAALEERQPENWTEAAIMLLRVDPADQRTIERRFRRYQKKMSARKTIKPNTIRSVIMSPPKWSKNAYAFVSIHPSEYEQRREIVDGIVGQVFETGNATRCLVIAQYCNDLSHPYSMCTVYYQRQVT